MIHTARNSLALATFAICMPALAGGTPLAPLLSPGAAQEPSYWQGAHVQKTGSIWASVTTALHHTDRNSVLGLYFEEVGPTVPASGLLSPLESEPTAGDLHNDLVAYVKAKGPGGAEMYAVALGSPHPEVNLSLQSAEWEDHPAVHGTRIVWQTGSAANGWEVMLNEFDPVTGGTTIKVGDGERPAIWSNLVAWEESGDITVYDISVSSLQWINSALDLAFPSIGGQRIFYEKIDQSTGVASIAYRASSSLGTEYLVAGPCASHYRPRVSGNGLYLLYTGSGCPAVDGVQPLYLTYVQPNAAQVTYLVADLGYADLHRDSFTTYDIDEDVIVYQVVNGAFEFDLYTATVDATQL